MGHGATAGYICSIYLESFGLVHILTVVKRFLISEEGLRVFLPGVFYE